MTAVLEICEITIKQLLGRRRTLLLVLLAALPVLLAGYFRLRGQIDAERYTRAIFETLTTVIVLPLVAILFGAGAFGAEIDEGTILYLLAKPIGRVWIVLAKAISAFSLAVLLLGVSTLLAGFLELVPSGDNGLKMTAAQTFAMVVGAACYVGLFMTLSLFTRRALVIGIGYMLVWEGALSSLLPGIANVSIRQYTLGASAAIYQLPLREVRLTSDTALILSAILVAGALVIGTWKLMRFELPGGD